jgi:hypothetical protein
MRLKKTFLAIILLSSRHDGGRLYNSPARMALLTAADLVCTWSFS